MYIHVVSCCVFVPQDTLFVSRNLNFPYVYLHMYVCMHGPVCMNMYMYMCMNAVESAHVHTHMYVQHNILLHVNTLSFHLVD